MFRLNIKNNKSGFGHGLHDHLYRKSEKIYNNPSRTSKWLLEGLENTMLIYKLYKSVTFQ